MKTAFNPPLAHLELADYGEIFFAIAHHVMEYSGYAKLYRERSDKGKFVIVDNGAYEKLTPLPPDELISQAKVVKAKEVIAPDILQKPILTLDLTKSFLSTLSTNERKQFRIMGVPQSKRREGWINEYMKMIQLDIDTVGIPKWLRHRDVIVQRLLHLNKLDFSKDHHLLGIDHMDELCLMPNYLIRSIDTKLPIHLGINLLSIESVQRPDDTDYFYQRLDANQIRHVLDNITEFKRICDKL